MEVSGELHGPIAVIPELHSRSGRGGTEQLSKQIPDRFDIY